MTFEVEAQNETFDSNDLHTRANGAENLAWELWKILISEYGRDTYLGLVKKVELELDIRGKAAFKKMLKVLSGEI